MAFHVACPITCQRICFCALGFPEPLRSEDGKKGLLEDVQRLEEFLLDPWFLRAGGRRTIQVLVPRVDAGIGRKMSVPEAGTVENGVAGSNGEEASSLQMKRALMQRKAVEASLAAEYYARRLETGELMSVSGDAVSDEVGEGQNPNTVKVICRLCFSGESEGSGRAARMISCRNCNKNYHRNCLKAWAQHRDLFDWNAWVCPSCRICEVCRKAGDPTKFMFCKRCDRAYHSYCQHHPHKNVTSGPYLCPNHTRCHSCGSTVPGNGTSTRWFLGYTCCDACGRLFVKEKYCPVCLKVYRDSESTPMVCCDVCQRWVHAPCDGISDEKYLQYQADSNLYYKCAACRGDCYKVKDIYDAVRELWRRRDNADRALIASLRAAAGLTEESVSVSPYSDDEECHVTVSRNDGKSFKGLSNSKENGKEQSKNLKLYKKYTKKKEMQTHSNIGLHTNEISESLTGVQSLENGREYKSADESGAERAQRLVFFRPPGNSPAGSGQNHPTGQLDAAYASPFKEKPALCENQDSKTIHIKYARSHGLVYEEANQKLAVKTEVTKGKRKLVIHLGSRNKNPNDISKLETSSVQREQDSAVSMGSEETSQQVPTAKERNPPELPMQAIGSDDKKGARFDTSSIKHFIHRSKDHSLFKDKAEVKEVGIPNRSVGGEITTGKNECNLAAKITYGKRKSIENKNMAGSETTLMNETVSPRKHTRGKDAGGINESMPSPAPVTSSKPLLKLKIKTLSDENHSLWVSQGDNEKNFIKGQRSKRKRPSQMVEKKMEMEDQSINELMHQDIPIDQETDARILKKLGKDAIGKRVEVHQASDNSWHRAVVAGTVEGRSALSVTLDDGRNMTLECGKQRVRFFSRKAKLTKR